MGVNVNLRLSGLVANGGITCPEASQSAKINVLEHNRGNEDYPRRNPQLPTKAAGSPDMDIWIKR